MRFLVLAAALLSAMPATAISDAGPIRPKTLEGLGPLRGDCPPTAAQQVAQQLEQQGHRPRLRRLVDLPPASAYAAVLRQVGGCEVPLVIRYDLESR